MAGIFPTAKKSTSVTTLCIPSCEHPTSILESHFPCGKGLEQSVDAEQTADFFSGAEVVFYRIRTYHFQILT